MTYAQALQLKGATAQSAGWLYKIALRGTNGRTVDPEISDGVASGAADPTHPNHLSVTLDG